MLLSPEGKVESHTPGYWTFYKKDKVYVEPLWVPVVTVKADSIQEARCNILSELFKMVMGQ